MTWRRFFQRKNQVEIKISGGIGQLFNGMYYCYNKANFFALVNGEQILVCSYTALNDGTPIGCTIYYNDMRANDKAIQYVGTNKTKKLHKLMYRLAENYGGKG